MAKDVICNSARCHDSPKKSCDCWCGGVFHGKGHGPEMSAFLTVWTADFPARGMEEHPAMRHETMTRLFQRAMAAAWKAADATASPRP